MCAEFYRVLQLILPYLYMHFTYWVHADEKGKCCIDPLAVA